MQRIREQNDLALLPEPCFVCTAPAWMRWFAAGLLVIGAVMAGSIFVNGMAEGGGLFLALGGAIATVLCLWILLYMRPLDWRVWTSLAATPEGLFLVARSADVVFVPWRDVIEIAVQRIGTRTFARLTLRMPDESWARFGNNSSIKGEGPVRQYLPSALTMPGNELVRALDAFRAEHAV